MMFRADELRSDARSIRSSTTSYPGPQSGSVGSRALHGGARRQAGARRARLCRRDDRRMRNAGAIEGVPRCVLRRDGARQHDSRSGRGHEGAREAVSVHRHRQGRHLGPLGRRLRHGRRDVPLSRTSSRSASPSRAITTSATTRTTGASDIRVCSEERRRHRQLRRRGQSDTSRRI